MFTFGVVAEPRSHYRLRLMSIKRFSGHPGLGGFMAHRPSKNVRSGDRAFCDYRTRAIPEVFCRPRAPTRRGGCLFDGPLAGTMQFKVGADKGPGLPGTVIRPPCLISDRQRHGQARCTALPWRGRFAARPSTASFRVRADLRGLDEREGSPTAECGAKNPGCLSRSEGPETVATDARPTGQPSP